MRCHVGKHTLNETVRANVNLCGYCVSYYVKFSMKLVENSTITTPCTNRPVYCIDSLCIKKVFWSYNMASHYKDCHLGLEAPSVNENERTAVLKSNY